MRKADLAIAVLLAAVGALVVADAVRLGFGWGPNGPEAGFFPFYLGLGLVICAAIVSIKVISAYRKQGPGKALIPPGAMKPLLWVLLPSVGMVMLTELVGIHLAAMLYLGFYMRAVGKVGWAKTVAIALVAPAVLYIAFDKVFMVPLPQGLWGAKLIPF